MAWEKNLDRIVLGIFLMCLIDEEGKISSTTKQRPKGNLCRHQLFIIKFEILELYLLLYLFFCSMFFCCIYFAFKALGTIFFLIDQLILDVMLTNY